MTECDFILRGRYSCEEYISFGESSEDCLSPCNNDESADEFIDKSVLVLVFDAHDILPSLPLRRYENESSLNVLDISKEVGLCTNSVVHAALSAMLVR